MGQVNAGERQAAVGPLLDAIREGDAKAFERLVESYWEPVMLYFWKRANTADAEDLAQDVFLAIYRAVRNGDGPAGTDPVSWRRYLFTCARHRLGGYWHRRAREPRAASLEDLLGDDELSWEATVSRKDGDRGGAAQLVTREESDAVRDCLDQIDAMERSICWLIFGEGVSKRQVAASVGIPESSLRDRLVGVLRELRRCLQGKGVEAALS